MRSSPWLEASPTSPNKSPRQNEKRGPHTEKGTHREQPKKHQKARGGNSKTKQGGGTTQATKSENHAKGQTNKSMEPRIEPSPQGERHVKKQKEKEEPTDSHKQQGGGRNLAEGSTRAGQDETQHRDTNTERRQGAGRQQQKDGERAHEDQSGYKACLSEHPKGDLEHHR